MRQGIIFILFIFISFCLHAQENKTYNTIRIKTAPEIDGNFDDEVWNLTKWEGNFIEFEPNEGEKPSQETYFKILYDDDNIYVAIRSLDKEPDKIEKRLSRRDEWEGDLAGVHFDSYFDKRTSFVFAVSAGGVKNDGFFVNDGDDFDGSWDPIWNVKTKVTSEGWNAEMEIPLSQLRFNKDESQVWGMEVVRSIFRVDELSLWSPISQNNPGWVSQYGQLHGIENVKPQKQIELAPFIVAKAEKYEKESGNPFSKGKEYDIEGGIDGKIGLTNDLILDFAINPDFGQVEADPSRVNLSAFESYFQEKRPFFIEGNNITNFQLTPGGSPSSRDNLFYSRRLGRSPHGYPEIEDHEFLKRPNNSRILGAFKVTGKTKNGWSIGVIESLTNSEISEIDNNGVIRKEAVEPMTNYFVARLQKDINKGNAIVGGMVTSTNRINKSSDLDFLPTTAVTGGLDFIQFFKEKKYFISALVAGSKVSGTKESIEELQLSSLRYFQRPDAEYLTFDPNKTSLFGVGGNIMTGKQSNSGFRYLANLSWRSPGLELNDIGYLRQANTVFQFIWISYKINKPFSIFRSINLNSSEWSGWDFGGNTIYKGVNFNFNTQFNNLWEIGTGIDFAGRNTSNTELRGGPAIFIPGGWEWWLKITSNRKKKLNSNFGFRVRRGNFDYSNFTKYYINLTYRPIKNLRFSLSPDYQLNYNEMQYVEEIESDKSSTYIFGELDQTTFKMTARVDYNITPDLTIQYYSSPFVSSGLFNDFKKIVEPKADNYNDRALTFNQNQIMFNQMGNYYSVDEVGDGNNNYSFDNPSFNFMQYRSNMVLRWEYVPGSTLFLVWSQGRTEEEDCDCKFDFKRNFNELFKTTPHDIFVLKLSYRIRAGKMF